MQRRYRSAASRAEPSKIDVNAMLLFYNVVNCDSINQAAERLKLSKSSISRKLRRLEEELGAVLLKRGQHKLSMTSSGEVLYHHCEEIIDESQHARTALAEMQSELAGKLQLVAPVGLGPWITRALSVFAHRYPRVEVAVDLTHRFVDVSEEPYDVAIHLGRIRNERLPVRRFAELARGVYASPSYIKDRSAPQTPVDLLRHSCIVLQQQLDDGIWTFREANGTSTTARPRARVSDIVVARDLAIAGLGFAILPHAFCRRETAAGQLVPALPRWNIPPLVPSATYLERRYVPLRIRAFLDTVAAQFKQDEIAA